MARRFEVKYVGDDSHTHRRCVWAESVEDAEEKIKQDGVDFVLSIHEMSHPAVGCLCVLGIIALIVLFSYLGKFISQ